MQKLLFTLLLVGCKFAPPTGMADGPTGDDDAPAGDGPPGASCITKWRTTTVSFDPPTKLLELTSNLIEVEPWISEDGLAITFVREESPGKGEIFVAMRTALDQPFGAIEPSLLSYPSSDESKASFTANFALAIFASNVALPTFEGEVDLYASLRAPAADPNGAWPVPTQVALAAVNTSGRDQDPWLVADGSRLYLSIDPMGAPKSFIAVSVFNTGIYENPTPVLAAGESDSDPALTADETVLVFTSNRAGGEGKRDLWYATRDNRNDAFDSPVHVPTVSGAEEDQDAALSADGCTLYFVSNRDGNRDLFMATVK
ncbi:MAG: hypothetical protein WKG01_35990 [Kofleriaceae bacterium]